MNTQVSNGKVMKFSPPVSPKDRFERPIQNNPASKMQKLQ